MRSSGIINNRKEFIKIVYMILFLAILDHSYCFRSQANYSNTDGENSNLKLPELFKSMNQVERLPKTTFLQPKTSSEGRDLGLILLGYAAKFCLYAYSYFKLICLCMFISVLFLLLCPLLPLLIPVLLLLLVVVVGLSITIPIAAVAGSSSSGGGGSDVTVISSGGGGAPPNFVSIPA